MNSKGKAVEPQSRFVSAISIGKDLVCLFRDGALILFAVLLLAFPEKLNVMLTDAGFVEGNFMGLKWEPKLVASQKALKQVEPTIAALQKNYDELASVLNDAQAKLSDPTLAQRIKELKEENNSVREAAESVQKTVSKTIDENAPLVKKAQQASETMASRADLTGYKIQIFYGSKNSDDQAEAGVLRDIIAGVLPDTKIEVLRAKDTASDDQIRYERGIEDAAATALSQILEDKYTKRKFRMQSVRTRSPNSLSIFFTSQ